MTVELKLDTNALMTLFPEGSEARVKLTQAVLAEAAKRALRNIAEPELNTLAADAVASVRREVSHELSNRYIKIVETGYSTNVALKPELIAKIKTLINTSVEGVIQEEIRAEVRTAFTKLEDQIKAQVDFALSIRITRAIEHLVKQEINKIEPLVKAKVSEVVSSILANSKE